MKIYSKLPDVGTSIFTIISAEAVQHNAINLAQGFPNFDCDSNLKQLVSNAMMNGQNQYAPMPGLLSLREEISKKFNGLYSLTIEVNDITITAGATQAIFTAIAALIDKGDEVIVIEPCYDSYVPSIQALGGIPKYLTCQAPSFEVDFDKLQSLISLKTKMIIVNTPGNPSTKIWTKEDWIQLSNIVEGTNICILSDEVYEHLVYDAKLHIPALTIDGLKDRTIAVYSFGKTFHNTGWKVGYAIAAPALMTEFRKVHQFNVFCVNSFVQYGLSDYLAKYDTWRELPMFYQAKRDLFTAKMKDSSFKEINSEGSFFTLYDYSNVSDLDDQTFVRKLIVDKGVAAIPLSSFYHEPRKEDRIIRLCFAKTEDVLGEGVRRLVE